MFVRKTKSQNNELKNHLFDSNKKVNLLSLNRHQMIDFFESLGEKRFRAQQIMRWIYRYGIKNFNHMNDISKTLRSHLSEISQITPPEIVSEHKSNDGVIKWMIRSDSASMIETVFIPEKNRGTLCVSSQVGCMLDCRFCSTGKQGFNSDLLASEIIGQVWLAAQRLKALYKNEERHVTNVVMMGMGEPLMNFDNVMIAMDLMMDDWGFGLSKRRVTLSTSGVVPAIHKMIGRTDVSLAISLHAPTDELRSYLVPINKKYPLSELLSSIKNYMDSLPDKSRVVTIEYTLIKNINDQLEHAAQLCHLLKNTPCKINLIPFNPFPNSGFEKPSNNAIHRFQNYLQQEGYNVTIRKTRGDEISAACGQLVGKVNDKTMRSKRYQAKQHTKTQLIEAVNITH